MFIKAWRASFIFSWSEPEDFCENCWKNSNPAQTIILRKLVPTVMTTESFRLQQIRSWKCFAIFSPFKILCMNLVWFLAWQLHRLILLFTQLRSLLQLNINNTTERSFGEKMVVS